MKCLDLIRFESNISVPTETSGFSTTPNYRACFSRRSVPHGAPWCPMAPPTNGPGALHPGRPSSRDPPSPRSPHASPSWPSLGLVAAAAELGIYWGYTNGAIGGYQLSFFLEFRFECCCWRMILSPKQIWEERGRKGEKVETTHLVNLGTSLLFTHCGTIKVSQTLKLPDPNLPRAGSSAPAPSTCGVSRRCPASAIHLPKKM